MKYLFALITTIALYSCSSLDLPETEDSNKFISENSHKLVETVQFINSKTSHLSSGSDIILKVKIDAINNLVKHVAFDKEKDIMFKFLQTKHLIKEEKNLLGISYTNFINIEHGFVDVNLKNIEFNKLSNNIAEAEIEIEGKGQVSVSGKYTGVPASVNSDIGLYLKEKVKFKLMTTDSGSVILIPQKQKLKLKTRISVQLLKWSIPWHEEIELELTDIVTPISVPLALSTVINFPLPTEEYNKQNLQYVPYNIEFENNKVSAAKDKIQLNTDILFKRK